MSQPVRAEPGPNAPPYVRHELLKGWVTELAALTQPDRVLWCDGSDEEYGRLQRAPEFMAREVAASGSAGEHTFVCTERPEDTRPNSRWAEPARMLVRLVLLFRDCMRGRTMYVMAYATGPAGTLAQIGVEITDSPRIVLGRRKVCRTGRSVFEELGEEGRFAPRVHSIGPQPEAGNAVAARGLYRARYIVQFPGTLEIWSFGTSEDGTFIPTTPPQQIPAATAACRAPAPRRPGAMPQPRRPAADEFRHIDRI